MAEWESWGSTPDPTISKDRLAPPSEWEIQVRAVSANNVASAWHSLGSLVVERDNTPPPQPANPVVTSELGTVTVTWSGKTFDGQDMPVDFSYCEIEQQGTPDFAVGSFGAANFESSYVITGLTAGEAYSFRLVAVDQTKNRSTASSWITVTVSSVLDDPGLEDAIIDKVQTEIVNSGRNRLIYSTLDPSVDGKEVTGDTWYKRSGNDIVGQWEWDGDSYEPKLLSHQAIGSLDAGKMTVGRLDGGIISAGSIGADKLVVGASSNLIVDPNLQNDEINAVRILTRWDGDQGLISVDKANRRFVVQPGYVDKIQLATTPYDRHVPPGGSGENPDPSNYLAVVPGQTYLVSARVQNTGNDLAYATIGFLRRTAAGAYTTDVRATWLDIPSSSTQTVTYSYTVPAGYGGLLPFVELDSDSTTGAIYVSVLEMYRQTDSVLIADGAITAQKLSAGSVAADKIAVGALDGKVITGATVRTAASGMRVEMSGSTLIVGDRPTNSTGVGWRFFGPTGLATVYGASSTDSFFTVNPEAATLSIGTGLNKISYNDVSKVLDIQGTLKTGDRGSGATFEQGWAFAADGYVNVYSSGSQWLTFNPTLSQRHVTMAMGELRLTGATELKVDRKVTLQTNEGAFRTAASGDRIELRRRQFGEAGGAELVAYPPSGSTAYFLLDYATFGAGRLSFTGDTTFTGKLSFYEGTNPRAVLEEASNNFRMAATYSLVLDCGSGYNIASPGIRAATVGSSNPQVYITANGSMGIVSSSRDSKVNIEDHEFSVDAYLSLNPKSWNWKKPVEHYADMLSRQAEGEEPEETDRIELIEDAGGLERGYGMIAEDVHDAGLSEFVLYNKDGSCLSLRYDQLWLPLLPIAKQHHSRIAELEEELAAIKAQLASLTNGLTP